ncbi:MFS transporter [bacterium]|nr:MFS transporter [bacterium]
MQRNRSKTNSVPIDIGSARSPIATSKETLREETVPLHSRIWVSAADGATAILCSIAEGAALTYYFTRIMGLAPRLASIVWLLFGIWNAFNDRLFGYISDRTMSRLGRRIPYIRYGAPLYAAAFAIFWIVLPGFKGNQTALFIQMLIGIGFAGSMYLIPLMNGDVIDADEEATDLRREGMYAGVNSFVTKPAISLAQAVFLSFLSHAGYDQSLARGIQSTSAEAGIVRAWFLVPAILPLACLLACPPSCTGIPSMDPSGNRSSPILPSCTTRRRRRIWPNTV